MKENATLNESAKKKDETEERLSSQKTVFRQATSVRMRIKFWSDEQLICSDKKMFGKSS